MYVYGCVVWLCGVLGVCLMCVCVGGCVCALVAVFTCS